MPCHAMLSKSNVNKFMELHIKWMELYSKYVLCSSGSSDEQHQIHDWASPWWGWCCGGYCHYQSHSNRYRKDHSIQYPIDNLTLVITNATGWLHPTINLDSPENGVDPITVVSGQKQQQNVRVALSNSFGFGGHNSCIMFKSFVE